jgi:hypothetical protein
MRRAWIAIYAAALLAAGCGSAKLTELQRVKSGQLDVVVLSTHDAIKHGQDSFVIEFLSPDGALVDVGDVRASATMAMPGMPMFGTFDVKKSATPGRYDVTSKFDMAGTWRTTIEWPGAPNAGSVTLSSAVQ